MSHQVSLAIWRVFQLLPKIHPMWGAELDTSGKCVGFTVQWIVACLTEKIVRVRRGISQRLLPSLTEICRVTKVCKRPKQSSC